MPDPSGKKKSVLNRLEDECNRVLEALIVPPKTFVQMMSLSRSSTPTKGRIPLTQRNGSEDAGIPYMPEGNIRLPSISTPMGFAFGSQKNLFPVAPESERVEHVEMTIRTFGNERQSLQTILNALSYLLITGINVTGVVVEGYGEVRREGGWWVLGEARIKAV